MKKVLIPWSGGLDSTYLIYKNLEDGNIVRTFSVKLLNNVSQSEREESARKVISSWFKEKYSNLFVETTDFNEIHVMSGFSHNLALGQAPLWVLFSNYSVAFCDIDEIQIGYVMNDDAISYIDDIKRLYKTYKPFMLCNQPKLTFPLIKLKKYEIINMLPEFLIKNISVCEYYGEKNCNCLSCERHKKELSYSKYHNLLDVEKKNEIKNNDENSIENEH